MTEAYNIDCMEYMRSLPDEAFDLAVVDPPYGYAQQEQEFREQGAHFVGRGRQKRYVSGEAADTHTHNASCGTDLDSGLTDTSKSVSRTGGTWAEKYAKKS